jgi:KilA-N domain/P63C domain
MNTIDLIDHHLDDFVIHQRKPDGYFDATAMCAAVDKRFACYRRLETTQEFLKELSTVVQIPTSKLIVSIQGGPPEFQGTWIHPDVAIHLAQWCSPKFAVAVSRWVREWFNFKVDVSGWLCAIPLRWNRMFPDFFYANIFRLKGKAVVPKEQAPWLADVTNDLIYTRLGEGVLEALQKINAVPEGKRFRPRKHHQHITEGDAKNQLRSLIAECNGMMSAFRDWQEFYPRWDALHPQVTEIPTEVEFQFADAQLTLFRLES